LHKHVAGGITYRVTKDNARIVGVEMVPFKPRVEASLTP
jgi:hypothetical protein